MAFLKHMLIVERLISHVLAENTFYYEMNYWITGVGCQSRHGHADIAVHLEHLLLMPRQLVLGPLDRAKHLKSQQYHVRLAPHRQTHRTQLHSLHRVFHLEDLPLRRKSCAISIVQRFQHLSRNNNIILVFKRFL